MGAALALSPTDHLIGSWRAGVLALPDDRAPVPGMLWIEPGPHGRAGVWAGVRTMMLRFIDHWGEEAAAIGWTTEALFGVHRLAGALRPESVGALVTLYPRKVVAMDARAIVTERQGVRQTYRGLKNPAESIPIWQFTPDHPRSPR